MKVQDFLAIVLANKDFFATGVPDSQLKALVNYLMATYGVSDKHIIAANEGNCCAIAAGRYLATKKVPLIYLQNSGLGNIVNPVESLLKIYKIPCIFVVGWRGEPGVHDEPQHIYQGASTLKLLEDLDVATMVIRKETTTEELATQMNVFSKVLDSGKSIAFVIAKEALSFDQKVSYKNNNKMTREEIIEHIVAVSKEDSIVSTTGKASRELFEIREAKGQGHQYDFLTVGSMGHSSSIALGIAINRPEKRIWCIDGDGAALMHMGSMAVIGATHPNNLVHIVINNEAHESVGGLPTVAGNVDLPGIAKSCGYDIVASAVTFKELDEALLKAKASDKLTFIEVKASIGARSDLGRPTTTPVQNRDAFMKHLME